MGWIEQLRFQSAHIFPENGLGAIARDGLADLVQNHGLNIGLETRGNMIALFSDTTVVSALQFAPEPLVNFLRDIGWGTNRHDGFHQNYTDFVDNRLTAIFSDPDLSPEAQKIAVLELHSIANEIHTGRIYVDINASTLAEFDAAFQSNRIFSDIDLRNGTIDGGVISALESYNADFDVEPQSRSDHRLKAVGDLLDGVKEAGILNKYPGLAEKLDGLLKSGESAAAAQVVAVLGEELNRVYGMGADATMARAGREAVELRLEGIKDGNFGSQAGFLYENHYVDGSPVREGLDQTNRAMPTLGDDFKTAFSDFLNKSSASAAGVLSAGEVAAFANEAYEPLRDGDYGKVAELGVKYGATALVVGRAALAILGGIAAVSPPGAAIAAAGLTVYGVAEIIKQTQELINKIDDDVVQYLISSYSGDATNKEVFRSLEYMADNRDAPSDATSGLYFAADDQSDKQVDFLFGTGGSDLFYAKQA